MHADAAAFRAAAALDAYEEQFASLHAPAADWQVVVHTSQLVHRACRCCAEVPRLRVASVNLLLSHHRLMATLLQHPAAARGSVGAAARAHLATLAELRQQCRDLFVSPHLQ
jgi:hypothetical protein